MANLMFYLYIMHALVFQVRMWLVKLVSLPNHIYPTVASDTPAQQTWVKYVCEIDLLSNT